MEKHAGKYGNTLQSVWKQLINKCGKTYGKHRKVIKLIIDTGYWILDTGYWVLDTRYWILDTGHWILDILSTGYWILDSGYRIQDTGSLT